MTDKQETNHAVTRPPTQLEIAARLLSLANEMDEMAVMMDYYGGFAEWAQHGREIAGAGNIARQWAYEIEDANGKIMKIKTTRRDR